MGNYSFRQVIIGVIIIAALIAVVYVALPAMGIAIPAWVVTMCWILAVAFVAILVINLLFGMWGGPPGAP